MKVRKAQRKCFRGTQKQRPDVVRVSLILITYWMTQNLIQIINIHYKPAVLDIQLINHRGAQ